MIDVILVSLALIVYSAVVLFAGFYIGFRAGYQDGVNIFHDKLRGKLDTNLRGKL